MIIETVKTLFRRDLNRLKSEIELYESDAQLWVVAPHISNSGGNLCLHLIGNLNAYIGAGLANTGYVRQRDLEFSQKDIPKAMLIKKIEETIRVVEAGLDTLSEAQMKDDFPIVIWEKATEMGFTLIHLTAHLSYHLGQINYHRRLVY